MFPEEAEGLRPGERAATTYYQQAQLDDDLGGRYAVSSDYPAQPETSPWANAPNLPEPPLGYAIDAQEPVGNFHEIQASIDALGDGNDPSQPVPAGESDRPLPSVTENDRR
jgi:hypothetical protein